MLELYREEQPHLRPLPLEGFRYFKPGTRTVDDAGLVQVDGVYYAALPAPLHSKVQVRIYARRSRSTTAPAACCAGMRRVSARASSCSRRGIGFFNPSRETARLLEKAGTDRPADRAAGPHALRAPRPPGQRALYGLTNLPRTYSCAEIEAVCGRFLEAECVSYAAIRRALERQAATAPPRPLS